MNPNSISSLFNDVAEKNNTKLAIKTASSFLTYYQVNVLSYQIAKHIYSEIGQDKIIATILPASIEYVLAIIGVNKSGNSFLPVDKKLPLQRISKMINHARPSLIITNSATASIIDGLNYTCPVFLLEVEKDKLILKRDENGNKTVLPEATNSDTCVLAITINEKSDAYVIYTSGTTGEPKAIVGRNDSLCHFIQWQIHQFQLEGIRGGMLTSIGFDVSLRDIFTPLLAGGELIIPDNAIKENIFDLMSWIKTEKIELLHVVPSIFRLLTNDISEEIPSLKYIFLAGEPLYWKDVVKWQEKNRAHTQLINLYGPSETTLAKLFYPIQYKKANEADIEKIVPLGNPLPNTAVYIISENKICKDGEIGEIVIATTYPSNGYLNNDELNEEKFKTFKLSDNEELHGYTTGDIGFLRNGIVEFCGRLDKQVKISGNRVEPMEIESILIQHNSISSAAVLIDDNDKENIKIIAFYTSYKSLRNNEILGYLKNNLPDYMIPNFSYYLEAFPLNVNGKVDYNKLLDYHNTQNKENKENPEHELDNVSKNLVAIIQNIISRDPKALDKTLMELGVSSLKAIQIVSAIYKEYKIKIPTAFILNNSISSIANYIEKNASALTQEPQDTFIKNEKEYYETTPQQQQMLFASKYSKESNLAYNVVLAYRIKGDIDEKKIQDFIAILIERNEIFRTTYHILNNSYVQKSNHAKESLSAYEKILIKEKDINSYLDNELNQGFDLLNDTLLLKVKFLEINEQDHIIIFKAHHITVDVWSLQIMIRDFINYYENGKLDEYNGLNNQYKHFTAYYNALLQDSDIIKSRAFWNKTFLKDINFVLPTDFKRPNVLNFIGENEVFDIESALSESVIEYIQKNNMSLFIFYTTVLSIVLKNYSNSENIVLGAPITLRDIGSTYNNTIGYFLNMMPIKIKVDNQLSFYEYATNQTKNLLEFYEHKHYPFTAIVENLNYKRELNRNPLFDYMVVEIEEVEDNFSMQTELIRTNNQTSKFDLTFFIIKSEHSLSLSIEYNTKLYRQETIRFILQQINSVIEQVMRNPLIPIHKLTLEKYQFGVEINETSETPLNENKMEHNLALHNAFLIKDENLPEELISPRNETEVRLFSIWKEILSTDQFGITDNFFGLGGTSIKAINMMVLINKEFNRTLTILDLFTYPDIQSFAEFLNTSSIENNSEEHNPIENSATIKES